MYVTKYDMLRQFIGDLEFILPIIVYHECFMVGLNFLFEKLLVLRDDLSSILIFYNFRVIYQWFKIQFVSETQLSNGPSSNGT